MYILWGNMHLIDRRGGVEIKRSNCATTEYLRIQYRKIGRENNKQWWLGVSAEFYWVVYVRRQENRDKNFKTTLNCHWRFFDFIDLIQSEQSFSEYNGPKNVRLNFAILE